LVSGEKTQKIKIAQDSKETDCDHDNFDDHSRQYINLKRRMELRGKKANEDKGTKLLTDQKRALCGNRIAGTCGGWGLTSRFGRKQMASM